jgi:hypothetical protein
MATVLAVALLAGCAASPNGEPPPDEQIEVLRLGCQMWKAEQAEGKPAAEAYFRQAMDRKTTAAEVFSERGYECTDEELIGFGSGRERQGEG